MGEIVRLYDVQVHLPGDSEDRTILQDLNLAINAGSHYAVLGANGSGKTTFLKLLAGDVWHTGGSIVWSGDNGPEASRITAHRIVKMVSPASQELWQRYAWNVTGMEMLASADERTPFAVKTLDHKQTWDAQNLLEKLDCPELGNMYQTAMSQGQLRLMLLARAIISKPRLLLLDEYLDGLDSHHMKKTFALLEQASKDIAMLFTSHRPETLPPWIDVFLEIKHGKIYPCIALPKTEKADISVTQSQIEQSENEKLLFCLKNATVFIDRKEILHNIDWLVRKGEHWRIKGDNASGKSTLLRLLAGEEYVAAGGEYIFYLSENEKSINNSPSLRSFVSIVSDLSQVRYDYNLAGLELICSGIENSVGLYRQYEKNEIDRAKMLLQKFFEGENFSEIGSRSIRRLSTGQLRRLFLARALIGRPKLLLLDEACNGLDAFSRHQFLALLNDIAHYGFEGCRPQIIFVSHYANDAPACINRIAEMKDGKLFVEMPGKN